MPARFRAANNPLAAFRRQWPVGRLSWTYDLTTTRYDRFQYDGDMLISEDRSASEAGHAPLPNRRYVHGAGVDEPLVWYEGAGTNDRRFLHADERGSIVAVSDNSGNVTNINRYDEYGAPASTNVGRFQYTGQTWLPQVKLYNFKARMYDPYGPRFLQADQIGYGDGPNRYAYGGGDPVNRRDPSGNASVCNTSSAESRICYRGDGAPTAYMMDVFFFNMLSRGVGGGGGAAATARAVAVLAAWGSRAAPPEETGKC